MKDPYESIFPSNNDHIISADLDSDPILYKVMIFGDQKQVIELLRKGRLVSVSINMENYNVYIGDNHYAMQVAAKIQSDKFCAGYIGFDIKNKKARIEDFSDWRNGASNAPSVKKAIEEAFERDLAHIVFRN